MRLLDVDTTLRYENISKEQKWPIANGTIKALSWNLTHSVLVIGCFTGIFTDNRCMESNMALDAISYFCILSKVHGDQKTRTSPAKMLLFFTFAANTNITKSCSDRGKRYCSFRLKASGSLPSHCFVHIALKSVEAAHQGSQPIDFEECPESTINGKLSRSPRRTWHLISEC